MCLPPTGMLHANPVTPHPPSSSVCGGSDGLQPSVIHALLCINLSAKLLMFKSNLFITKARNIRKREAFVISAKAEIQAYWMSRHLSRFPIKSGMTVLFVLSCFRD
jgi:hypothetical protein